jgi:trk system potassium uptake protein
VFLFIITIIVGMFGFLLFGMGTFDSLAISIAMVTNSGPGLGVFGPMGGFATLPELGKVFSCILMWVGRLEIATALVLFTRNFWEELLKGRPIGDDIRRKMRPMRRRM